MAAWGDGPDVVLVAPGQSACREAGGGRGGDGDGRDCMRDGGGEQRRGCPGGRAGGGAVRAVESDDGVEVDDAAPLVFGDLGVGDPELLAEGFAGESGLAG